MRNRHRKFWIIALVLFFFIVGVPIIINESYKLAYKTGFLYVTMWEASDMLNYYSAVLGGGATIIALAYTIAFTRMQLRRDRFLATSHTKCEKIESIVSQALLDISPLKMRDTSKLDGSLNQNIHTIISHLQTYALTAKTSLDTVKCYVTPDEYDKIAPYISELWRAIEQFCAIENELEQIYANLQQNALLNGGKILDELLNSSLNAANQLFKTKIPDAYNGPYQNLLNMKRDVFRKIYAEIDDQADPMLLFTKNRGDIHHTDT